VRRNRSTRMRCRGLYWTALSTGTAQRWSDATLCTPMVQILVQTTSSTSTRCNKTWWCAKQVQVPPERVHFSWAPNRSTHKKCRPLTTGCTHDRDRCSAGQVSHHSLEWWRVSSATHALQLRCSTHSCRHRCCGLVHASDDQCAQRSKFSDCAAA
jgi:hypothetical protein